MKSSSLQKERIFENNYLSIFNRVRNHFLLSQEVDIKNVVYADKVVLMIRVE